MACAVASNLAQPGDEIILNNQGVVKATPTPRKGTVKDQDYRDPGFANVTSKGLTVRWTPGHRELKQATTYRDYQDIIGNNDSDTLANDCLAHMLDSCFPWVPLGHATFVVYRVFYLYECSTWRMSPALQPLWAS